MPALRDATACPPPAYPGALRVSGTLTHDAKLTLTTGHPAHALLCVHFAPHCAGLPYEARIDLGTDVADHMAAEALMPHLRRGACFTVAGEALGLYHEHGLPVLHVLHAHSAVLLQHAPADAPAAQPAPDLFQAVEA